MMEHTMAEAHSSDTTSQGVRVRVTADHRPEHELPGSRQFLFAYQVTIDNGGDRDVTLVRRHWQIIDADGQLEEIDGAGVVGRQPRIEQGETFNYSSFCPLRTSWGTMEGHFTMRDDDGAEFSAIIGRVHLFVREPVASR